MLARNRGYLSGNVKSCNINKISFCLFALEHSYRTPSDGSSAPGQMSFVGGINCGLDYQSTLFRCTSDGGWRNISVCTEDDQIFLYCYRDGKLKGCFT